MNPEIEDRGTLQAQKDWSRLVSPIGFYKGGLGPEYNFISVRAVPRVKSYGGVLNKTDDHAGMPS